MVLISGEPGIGKSRLTRALREELTGASHTWLEAQCSPWSENTAFYPVIELHRRLLGIRDQDPPEETLARLEAALEDAGLAVDEALPLFAALHGIPLPEERQPPPMSREAQRRKTLETLCEWVIRLGHERPVVFLIEDVQWIDPSTAELVEDMIDQCRRAAFAAAVHAPSRLLTRLGRAGAAGDPARPDWSRTRRAASSRTSRPEHGLPPERMLEIVARSEGVPLYLEELTKAVLESASAPFTTPATLRDSLMSRLDRLGPAKELALLASVIGREFSYPLIAAASPDEEPGLRAGLAQLVESELVFQVGEPPDARYRFKHALIRDEAYQSLFRSARRQYHERIGQTLEAQFPHEAEARPELVAHHFLEAGDSGKGVQYLTMAARRAVTTSANVEAIHAADRGARRAERLARVGAAEPARDGPLHAPRRGPDRDPRLCVG